MMLVKRNVFTVRLWRIHLKYTTTKERDCQHLFQKRNGQNATKPNKYKFAPVPDRRNIHCLWTTHFHSKISNSGMQRVHAEHTTTYPTDGNHEEHPRGSLQRPRPNVNSLLSSDPRIYGIEGSTKGSQT